MKLTAIISSFNSMHRSAYRMLTLCLCLILISIALFCMYLTKASESVLFSMWAQKRYITDSALSAVLLSFGGAFLLDIAHKQEDRK